MNEQYFDEMLHISTTGDQDGFNKSFHYHRYEPTPYSALEELFNQYKLKSSDRIVDFGCGKGRLNFFINYMFQASVVGIEMNEMFYEEALENRKNYCVKNNRNEDDIQFYCCLAQDYPIDDRDNKFYFFNPFSIQIFMNIVNNILLSVEEEKREVELILYYCSEDYIFYLENQTSFELKKEIILPGLYEHDPYEKFLLYRLVY